MKVSKDNIYLMYKNRISVLSRKGDEISKISPPFGYIFIALLMEKNYLLYVKEIITPLISMEEMIGNLNMIF